MKAYEQAITPKTKIIHVTHMVNWIGQTMPVAKIADMAHAHGIEVIADGAHSFGLMDFKVPDLHATTSARACTSSCPRQSARG